MKLARGGLFRAILAGAGHTLADAFASLEQAQHVDQIWRHAGRDLIGARISLAPDEGEGYWELTKIGEDVYIVVENFAYKDPRVEFVPGDGLVQFYFKLSGDLTMAVRPSVRLRLNRPSLLIYNQPTGVDIREWTAPRARERCVQIGVRPQFLIDTFLTCIVDAPPQLHSYVTGATSGLQYCQLPLDAQMFELATKLVDNPYSGALGLMHSEAVALELLCAAIAGFAMLAGRPAEEYSERELRCLHAARDVLMKQLSSPPTIRQVARAAGINETTLKRGFQSLFGTTIFEFSVRCRMHHALVLLREQRLPVARVAEAVGYSHQTSFATAFRRHFGLRPKDVRRSLRTH